MQVYHGRAFVNGSGCYWSGHEANPYTIACSKAKKVRSSAVALTRACCFLLKIHCVVQRTVAAPS